VCSPPLGASPIIIQHMSLISAQISSSYLPTIPVQDGPLSITRESGQIVADEAEKCRTVMRVSSKLQSKEDRSSERR
jgi:hypothetical protein